MQPKLAIRCPDSTPDCLKDGLDVHLHIAPDGVVTVLSSVPTACGEDSPHNWWAALRNRGFMAFAVKPEEEETDFYEN